MPRLHRFSGPEHVVDPLPDIVLLVAFLLHGLDDDIDLRISGFIGCAPDSLFNFPDDVAPLFWDSCYELVDIESAAVRIVGDILQAPVDDSYNPFCVLFPDLIAEPEPCTRLPQPDESFQLSCSHRDRFVLVCKTSQVEIVMHELLLCLFGEDGEAVSL